MRILIGISKISFYLRCVTQQILKPKKDQVFGHSYSLTLRSLVSVSLTIIMMTKLLVI